jgi:catechol 2,3-dioxygenase-like lactoylglutathione lyase family enzyme
MAKLRHIALYAEDAIAAAHFYRDAFEMEIVRESANACSLTDGVMNVTIIRARDGFPPGIHHFGMWVDDLEEGQARAVKAGAIFHQGPPPEGQGAFEIKYMTPDAATIFDITHTGWPGSVKDVAAKPKEPAPAK